MTNDMKVTLSYAVEGKAELLRIDRDGHEPTLVLRLEMPIPDGEGPSITWYKDFHIGWEVAPDRVADHLTDLYAKLKAKLDREPSSHSPRPEPQG